MGGIAPTIGGRFQPLTAPKAGTFGYQDWNFDPVLLASSSAVTSQTIYAISFYAYAGTTYTGVALAVAVAGTSTAPTGFFVGIASNAVTGIMQAQSGNLKASTSLTTLGLQKFPFSATWTPTASGMVEVIILQNGAFAGTNVTFGRMGVGSVNAYSDGTNFIAATAGTAQTALPANAAALPAAYTTANALPYWIALY